MKLINCIDTTDAFVAYVITNKMAANAKHAKIYPVHYISKRFMKPYFLLTMAIEADILNILVSFIKNTEFTDCDLVNFLDEAQNVVLDLCDLNFEKGYTAAMFQRIQRGDLSHIEGGGELLDETEWRQLFDESIETSVVNWKERFPEEHGESN